jgi:hypothetical protein
VFKIVHGDRRLGSGAITPETTFPEQAEAGADGLARQRVRIRNSHSLRQGQALTLGQATEISSNIYFALVGLATGGENMVEFAERLGFGAPLPFDLPTAASQVTNGRGDEPGGFVDDVELANAAYGQGETFVTPSRWRSSPRRSPTMACCMKPRLVTALEGKRGTREIGPEQLRRVIPADDAQAIQRAMRRAVEGDLGRQFTSGAQGPRHPDRRQVGHGRARAGGRAPLVVHRLRAGQPATRRDRVVVERAGRGRRVPAPIAGDLMQAYFEDSASERGPSRPTSRPQRAAAARTVGMAAIAW